MPVPPVRAASAPATVLNLPVPGSMVTLSSTYHPTIIRGLTINPENPLKFDFLVDSGDEPKDAEFLSKESSKLIKYFLAAMTTPENEMWVNLSPYEKNRIIPDGFGRTEMGRDLLAQDYLLKQLSASLMYPEDELGEKFWHRVHQRAQAEFGTTDIPMNTFNKIWIVPEQANVMVDGQTVFVVDSHLKVMLEEDYLSLSHHTAEHPGDPNVISELDSQIVREILIPEIEREVNEGRTFANLRQIFNSVILATWYKQNLKQSFLTKVYADQSKTDGITSEDEQINQKIYEQYVQAFQKGVYNYIKEDLDPQTQETIPRKYFSGGADLNVDVGMLSSSNGKLRKQILRSLRFLTLVSASLLIPSDTRVDLDSIIPYTVAPQTEQAYERKLFWVDGSQMLGEQNPGIVYYNSPSNSYLALLDPEDGRGGQGEAARIKAAGFNVVKVYTTDLTNMRELEFVSRIVYRKYGLRFMAVFSPQINGSLINENEQVVERYLNYYVQHLARHPWVSIQLGNEDHYYLNGELLAPGQSGIPMTLEEYYQRYDQIAASIKSQLARLANEQQRNKPILLGQGIRIGQDSDWRQRLDRSIAFINAMENIDGVTINAYMDPPELYGPVTQYISEGVRLPVVVGELGKSSLNIGADQQLQYNQRAWAVLQESMRQGHAAGAVLFAWNDKVEGDEAPGFSATFQAYDRKFGIQNSLIDQPYFTQPAPHTIRIQQSEYNTSDNLFWRAVANPRLNRDFLVWYSQQLQENASRQQQTKTAVISELNPQGIIMTDDQINSYHDLNFMGEALYQLAVIALYDGDYNELERLYDQMYVYYPGAQMYYGPRSFWVPFDNIKAQIQMVGSVSEPEVRERLRLMVDARSMQGKENVLQNLMSGRDRAMLTADTLVSTIADQWGERTENALWEYSPDLTIQELAELVRKNQLLNIPNIGMKARSIITNYLTDNDFLYRKSDPAMLSGTKSLLRSIASFMLLTIFSGTPQALSAQYLGDRDAVILQIDQGQPLTIKIGSSIDADLVVDDTNTINQRLEARRLLIQHLEYVLKYDEGYSNSLDPKRWRDILRQLVQVRPEYGVDIRPLLANDAVMQSFVDDFMVSYLMATSATNNLTLDAANVAIMLQMLESGVIAPVAGSDKAERLINFFQTTWSLYVAEQANFSPFTDRLGAIMLSQARDISPELGEMIEGMLGVRQAFSQSDEVLAERFDVFKASLLKANEQYFIPNSIYVSMRLAVRSDGTKRFEPIVYGVTRQNQSVMINGRRIGLVFAIDIDRVNIGGSTGHSEFGANFLFFDEDLLKQEVVEIQRVVGGQPFALVPGENLSAPVIDGWIRRTYGSMSSAEIRQKIETSIVRHEIAHKVHELMGTPFSGVERFGIPVDIWNQLRPGFRRAVEYETSAYLAQIVSAEPAESVLVHLLGHFIPGEATPEYFAARYIFNRLAGRSLNDWMNYQDAEQALGQLAGYMQDGTLVESARRVLAEDYEGLDVVESIAIVDQAMMSLREEDFENIRLMEIEGAISNPDTKLGKVVFTSKEIQGYLQLVGEKTRYEKGQVFVKIQARNRPMIDAMVEQLFEYIDASHISSGRKYEVIKESLNNIYVWTIENQIDAYLLRRQNDPDFTDDLEIEYYMTERDGQVSIYMVSNANLLDEDNADIRLGGWGEGYAAATKFVNGIQLQGKQETHDRKKMSDQQEGSVYIITVDRTKMRIYLWLEDDPRFKIVKPTDQAMAATPEIELREREKKLVVAMEGELTRMFAELRDIVGQQSYQNTARKQTELERREQLLVKALRNIYTSIESDIPTGQSYDQYSQRLKELKAKQVKLSAQIEREDGVGNKTELAQLNLESVDTKRQLLKMQILVAGLLLTGKSRAGTKQLVPALNTLDGALNTAHALEVELDYRIQRLHGQQLLKRYQSDQLFGERLRLYRLGLYEVTVGDIEEDVSGPSVTISQQVAINVHTTLDQIRLLANRGEIELANQRIQRLRTLYTSEYMQDKEKYPHILRDLDQLETSVMSGIEGVKLDASPEKDRIERRVKALTQRVQFPKQMMPAERTYRNDEKLFHSRVRAMASELNQYMRMLKYKTDLKYFVKKIQSAQRQMARGRTTALSQVNRAVIKRKLEKFENWVRRGHVEVKVDSDILSASILEHIDANEFAEAEAILNRIIIALEQGLTDIRRLTGNLERQAVKFYERSRRQDIVDRVDVISNAITDSEYESAMNLLLELSEQYFTPVPSVGSYRRAHQKIQTLIRLFSTIRNDGGGQLIFGADEFKLLTQIKDDIHGGSRDAAMVSVKDDPNAIIIDTQSEFEGATAEQMAWVASENVAQILDGLGVSKDATVVNLGSGFHPVVHPTRNMINVDKQEDGPHYHRGFDSVDFYGSRIPLMLLQADFMQQDLIEELGKAELHDGPVDVAVYYNMSQFFRIYGYQSSDLVAVNLVKYLGKALDMVKKEGQVVLFEHMSVFSGSSQTYFFEDILAPILEGYFADTIDVVPILNTNMEQVGVVISESGKLRTDQAMVGAVIDAAFDQAMSSKDRRGRAQFEMSEIVNADFDVVYRAVTVPSQVMQWGEGVEGLQEDDGTYPQVGRTYRWNYRLFNRIFTLTDTITQADAKAGVFTSENQMYIGKVPFLAWNESYKLFQEADGVRVHNEVDMTFKLKFLAPLLNAVLVKPIARGQVGESIAALKKYLEGTDQAMISSDNKGGIDLNPNLLELTVEGDQIQIQVPTTFDELNDVVIDGFVPVIQNITPVVNVPFLLGWETQGDQPIQSSQQDTTDRLSYVSVLDRRIKAYTRD